MDVCRLCNRPVRAGQKVWRLGSDVEHERCSERRPPEQYIHQLRSVVRALSGVRRDLIVLGQTVVRSGLHERKDGPQLDVETPMHRAAEQLRSVIKLLARAEED